MRVATATLSPAKELDRLRIPYREHNNELWLACPWCHRDGMKDGGSSVNAEHGAFRCLHGKCNRKASFYEVRVALKDTTLPSAGNFKREEKKWSQPRTLSIKNTEHQVFKEWLAERGLTAETAAVYGVVLTKYDVGGTPIPAIAFPHTEHGVEVYRQYRLKSGDDAKAQPWKTFKVEAGCRPVLFGRDQCDLNDRYVIITEGQCDAMAAYQMGWKNAVSIPQGVENFGWIDESYDWLMGFEDVVIATDADVPGEKCAEEIARRLGSDRCRRLKLPYKDLNDCLKHGWGQPELWKAIKAATDYKPKKLNSMIDYIDEAVTARDEGAFIGTPTPWDAVTERLQGFRDGECTMWSGDDGVGKSTALLNLLVWNAAIKVGTVIGSFEMRPTRYINWMSDMLCQGEWTKDKAKAELTRIAPYVWVVDHVGIMKQEELLNIYRYAARRYGAKQFITDSLFMVCQNEYDLDESAAFVHRVKDFAMDCDVHHHLVSHARKGESDKATGKDKASIAGGKILTKIHENVILVCDSDKGVYFELNKVRDGKGPQKLKVYMKFDVQRRLFIHDETVVDEPQKKKRGRY